MPLSTPTKSGYANKRRKRRYINKRKYVTAAQAARIAKSEVKKEEKKTVELKIADKGAGPILVTRAGVMVNLTNFISAGVNGFDNRIGDQINLKSWLFRYYVDRTDDVNCFRMVCFRWMSDSTPTVANIFDTTGSVLSVVAPLEKDTAHNVQVIFDELLTLSSATDTRQVGKIYRKLGGHAEWSTGSTSGKGQLYIAFISDAPITGCAIHYWSRVRFTDE